MNKKRILTFLEYCGLSEEENKFRLMDVKLVSEDTGNSQVVKQLIELNKITNKVLEEKDSLNKLLNKYYHGKLKFDFVFEEEGESLSRINLDDRKKSLINDKISKFLLILQEEKIKIERKKSLHDN